MQATHRVLPSSQAAQRKLMNGTYAWPQQFRRTGNGQVEPDVAEAKRNAQTNICTELRSLPLAFPLRRQRNLRRNCVTTRVGRIMLKILPIILFPYSYNIALLFSNYCLLFSHYSQVILSSVLVRR